MKNGAFILARYSTDRQNEETIEVQVEKCSEWCQKNGIPILDVFADMAVSGMKDTRPQYSRMMAALRKGEADTVVIYDQSRMFRKMTAWFTFRDEMEILGVRVVSVTQPTIGGDLRDPSNFLIEGSMALFNQMWVLQTRQKVTEAMYHMARQGRHTGGTPPLGYKIEDGVLVIDEEEAEIVRQIFRAYASGRSYREIIADLNRQGRRTKSGGAFGSNSLHDLLRNEKYVGTVVYGQTRRRSDGKRNTHGAPSADAIRVENGCPAIVDRYTFDKVQERMDENKSRGGRPVAREQPLKGKVFCGDCKRAMTVHYSGKARADGYKNSYYICTGKQRLHDCDMPIIRRDTLEQWVAKIVREQFLGACDYDTLGEQIRTMRDEILRGAGDQMKTLTTRYREVCRQLGRATDAILDGLTSETLSKKIQDLEAEKTSLDKSMQELKRTVGNAQHTDEEIMDLVKRIRDLAAGSDADVLALVLRVEVYRDYIAVWTIIDDPDWRDDDSDSDMVTSRTVQDVVPINPPESLHNSWCGTTGTMKYANSYLIMAFCMPRPVAEKGGGG